MEAGITADPSNFVGVSGRDPRARTRDVQQMKTSGSNFSLMTSSVTSLLEMRDEATLQGLDNSKIVWATMSAYGNTVVTQNASSFEGEYQSLTFLPFEEPKADKTLTEFLANMKAVGGTPDQFAVYAWGPTLAFADATKAAVAKHGLNGITRTTFVEAWSFSTAFDAAACSARIPSPRRSRRRASWKCGS